MNDCLKTTFMSLPFCSYQTFTPIKTNLLLYTGGAIRVGGLDLTALGI